LGANTDLYLDISTGNVYQKSSNIYGLICNITGPQGDPGPTGPAGANGASELWPQVINYSNTGAGAADVKNFTIGTTALAVAGDAVHIRTEVTTPPTDPTKIVKHLITVGSTTYQLQATLFNQTSGSFITYGITNFKFYLRQSAGVSYLNVRIDIQYKSLGVYGIATDLSGFARVNLELGVYTLGDPLTFTVDFSSCAASTANLFICEGINYKTA
jgi:hypothetical protein